MKLSSISIFLLLGFLTPEAVALKPSPRLKKVPLAQYSLRLIGKAHDIVRYDVCHEDIVPNLLRALDCTVDWQLKNNQVILFNYGGCYSPRKIRGSDVWSNHAYGRAVDLNIPNNQSRYTNWQHPELVKCFKQAGFSWGGDWRRPDYMHFEILEEI